jgi:hypothetical protein
MVTNENVLTEIDDEQEDQENEEIIIVEEPPVEEAEADISTAEEVVEEDNEAVPQRELLEDEEDKEREAIRQRRRREKIERKERRDAAIKRDKTELAFLRSENQELNRRISAQEKRSHQGELHALDSAIQQAAQEAEMAEQVIAKAVENGNGEDVTQAMRYRDEAIAKVNQLQINKQRATAQSRQAAAPPVDNRTMHYAQQFIKENPWYDAQGRDEDSAIVMAIDKSLAKDGYNPQTEEYWDELKVRASRRLPERFDGDHSSSSNSSRKPRGGPVMGSGREHAPTSTRKEVYISPERKAALQEAGVWDDHVLRDRYVKSYAQYDKENG